MQTMTDQTLTPQGEAIVTAIEAGLAAMTEDRWLEIRRQEREDADAGVDDGAYEWFAPEFAAARTATEGITWDFSGWADALNCIMSGYGKLGGVSLVADLQRQLEQAKSRGEV